MSTSFRETNLRTINIKPVKASDIKTEPSSELFHGLLHFNRHKVAI